MATRIEVGEPSEKTKPKEKISVARRVFSIILFIILSPIIAIVALFVFAYRYDKKRKFMESDKKGKFLLLETDITKIDIMQGYEFEELVRTVYFYLGYKTELTKKSRDFGADIILEDPNAKKIVVQAKRYNGQVGTKAVQEIHAAKQHYGAEDAWVVTNSHFSVAAEELARETNVRLIDREEFMEHYARAKTQVSTNENRKEEENVGSTSFDGFGNGEFRI